MPTSSLLFQGRFRSAFTHSWISLGRTRRTKTSRSATVKFPRLLLRGRNAFWKKGQLPYRKPGIPMSNGGISEIPRRSWVADREDRWHDPSRLESNPLLSPKGDTAE